MMEFGDVFNFGTKSRVSCHNHITGLGLNKETGEVLPNSTCGLIGQESARMAGGIIVDMIKGKHLAGKGILFVGPVGSGKSAVALAISRELGNKIPFCQMSGSEIYSCEVKKASILIDNFRKAIGVRIKDVKEVYEGELLDVKETIGAGPEPVVIQATLKLKSTKGTKQLVCNAQTFNAVRREKVTIGDVVHIEIRNGFVKRIGKCDAYSTEYDLEVEEYVPLPKGDVYRKREVTHDITLHDMDVAYAKPDEGDEIITTKRIFETRKTEITDRLREEVNKKVNEYVEQGNAELIPGVLFIDDIHVFDLETFTFLQKVLDSNLSPTIILATNIVEAPIGLKGDEFSPHGIPYNLLDRLLIVRTTSYKRPELKSILKLRMEAEGVTVNEDGLNVLTGMADKFSLRYAIQLLTPAWILAKAKNHSTVTNHHVSTACKLFKDGNNWMRILTASDHFYG